MCIFIRSVEYLLANTWQAILLVLPLIYISIVRHHTIIQVGKLAYVFSYMDYHRSQIMAERGNKTPQLAMIHRQLRNMNSFLWL